MKKVFLKNKMAVRLTGYFSIVLVIFGIVVSSAFAYLFQQHTIALHQKEMQIRAEHLAAMAGSTVLNASNKHGEMNGNGMLRGGHGMGYMRLLDSDDFGDAWIIDENMNLLIRQNGKQSSYNYKDLPPDAASVVKKAFQGNIAFSEGFSDLLAMPTMTVGVPIYDDRERIMGVVLLHSPIAGIAEATRSGVFILLSSMLLALLLALLLAVPLSYSFTKPLNKMNRMAALLAAGDYTARTEVRKKDEIGALASTLDVLSEQLHAASQEQAKLENLRREFIANISHELRTPVTVLRGSLEAICDKVVTEPAEVAKYQQEMLRESIYLQRLVNDVLELSRLQNTDFKIEKTELDLCAVVQDAVRFTQKLAEEKQLELQTCLAVDFYPLQGDYGRLRQLLIILLDNAVKFSPRGGKIAIALQNNELTVANDGEGIPAVDLPYLFDRFYRSRDEANKSGTGLGLAIAKQIGERHGIRILVSSETPGQTVFKLLLPRLGESGFGGQIL